MAKTQTGIFTQGQQNAHYSLRHPLFGQGIEPPCAERPVYTWRRGSPVSGLGNHLAVNVALLFKAAFGEVKHVYMYAVDSGGLWTYWQQRGPGRRNTSDSRR